jgi:hypothetical protein
LPVPTPRDDEEENDFISRCMSNETMKDDFPDNDQRLAVCFSAWERGQDDKSFPRRFRALRALQRLKWQAGK